MRIHYYGHVGQRSGYGRAATDLCKALVCAGHKLQIRPLCKPSEVDLELAGILTPLLARECQGVPDATIVHTLPYDCRRVFELAELGKFAGVKNVAYTTWEAVSKAPDIDEEMACFDEVWVPSESSAFPNDSSSTVRRFRCRVLHHCFDETLLDDWRAQTPMSIEPGRFLFYYMGAWSPRKNPIGLVRAFAHAFEPDEPVGLLIHSPGVDRRRFDIALLTTGLESHSLPWIGLSSEWMPDQALWQMHARGDCFVTASRGEAWNLPAFEAYLMGKPMIVPRGHGSDEYLGAWAQDHRWMRYRTFEGIPFIDAAPGPEQGTATLTKAHGLDARAVWREPDLIELAEFMYGQFRQRHRPSHVDVSQFGYEAVAKTGLSYLEGAP